MRFVNGRATRDQDWGMVGNPRLENLWLVGEVGHQAVGLAGEVWLELTGEVRLQCAGLAGKVWLELTGEVRLQCAGLAVEVWLELAGSSRHKRAIDRRLAEVRRARFQRTNRTGRLGVDASLRLQSCGILWGHLQSMPTTGIAEFESSGATNGCVTR